MRLGAQNDAETSGSVNACVDVDSLESQNNFW